MFLPDPLRVLRPLCTTILTAWWPTAPICPATNPAISRTDGTSSESDDIDCERIALWSSEPWWIPLYEKESRELNERSERFDACAGAAR